MWGYDASSPGPVIETRSGEGLFVEWVNNSRRATFFPSITICTARKKINRTSDPWCMSTDKDAAAERWLSRSLVCSRQVRTYYYPNEQEPAALWYHDHAMGINRLNIYAGLFGQFLIRDPFEDALKLPKGKYEIPLAVYDRSFGRDGSLISGIRDSRYAVDSRGVRRSDDGQWQAFSLP